MSFSLLLFLSSLSRLPSSHPPVSFPTRVLGRDPCSILCSSSCSSTKPLSFPCPRQREGGGGAARQESATSPRSALMPRWARHLPQPTAPSRATRELLLWQLVTGVFQPKWLKCGQRRLCRACPHSCFHAAGQLCQGHAPVPAAAAQEGPCPRGGLHHPPCGCTGGYLCHPNNFCNRLPHGPNVPRFRLPRVFPLEPTESHPRGLLPWLLAPGQPLRGAHRG